jgi:hypothetical protein
MTTAARPKGSGDTKDEATVDALVWSLEEHTLRVENSHYAIGFDLSEGVVISDWEVGPNRVQSIAEPGAQLFDLVILSDRDPRPLGTGNIGTRPPRAWVTQEVQTQEAGGGLKVGVRLASDVEHVHAALWVELSFSPADTWFCALRSEGVGRTLTGTLGFPFLRHVAFEGDRERTRTLLLGRLPIRHDEARLPVFTLDDTVGLYSTFSPDGVLPNCFMDSGSGVGIQVRLDQAAFNPIPPPAASLADARYPVVTGAWGTQVVRLAVGLGGSRWSEVFEDHRTSVRERLQLDNYERAEQRWFRSAFTQLFANVHSQEVYDRARGGYVLDEYVQDARTRFGGVDTLVLWTSYPNLGIDERDQFDLIDDLPGGRVAIRKLFDQMREGGTRPFIAYLPWHTADPDVDHAAEVARLVGDVGADGVLLDSMWSAHPRFREELDKAGLSHVVFVTEYRPPVSSRMESLSQITGSWAQNLPKAMPSVDLLRFELPEHKVFVVDRNARERKSLTRVAFFSGNGIVLWDRNFGSPGFMHEGANLYSAEDEAFTRRCYSIWRAHVDAFTSPRCEPLVESLDPRVFINAFKASGKIVYTLFNAGSGAYAGPIVRLGTVELEDVFGKSRPQLRAHDAWADSPADIDVGADGITVNGSIDSEEIGCIVLSEETR